MTSQIVVKPQGLITEPNKTGQFPPGAFALCNNVAIRSFGLVDQVKKLALSAIVLPGAPVGGMYTISDGGLTALVYEAGTPGTWMLTVIVTSSSASSYNYQSKAFGSTYSAMMSANSRTGLLLIRNRLIVSGSVRSFVFDLFPSDAGPNVTIYGPRDCGLYTPIITSRIATTGISGDPEHVAPNTHFSASVTQRVKFSDGYELVSPPVVPGDYANLSTTLPQIRSTWTVRSVTHPEITVASFNLDIYRTRPQSVGYDSGTNKYLPVSTGSSFYLAKTVRLVLDSQTVVDQTLPNTLGEALLTNVNVGGASALPLPPPPAAKTCAAFRGHAFYANYWDPATFTLLNPYYWGFMFMPTASTALLTQGIGSRYTTGGQTATSGSPTITGLPNTLGVVPGQTLNVYRVDTGVLVTSNNNVVSTTATTVTGTSNSTYSGNVSVYITDRIEVCGANRSATDSMQEYVQQLLWPVALGDPGTFLDVAAVGLEPAVTNSPAGVYPGFVPTGGVTFRMRTVDPFTIRATNGHNFSPAVPEITSAPLSIFGRQAKNAFTWSENNEPENVPPSNYAFAGSGEIHKTIETRDCLWFWCSDGLYRLSGSGGSVGEENYDWVIDPVDPSISISNPDCAVKYRDYVYALTSRGVVSVSSEGVIRDLSDGRVNPPIGLTLSDATLENSSWKIPVSGQAVSNWPWLAADDVHGELWVRCIAGNQSSTSKIWVYNINTDTWCTRRPSQYAPTTPMRAVYNSGLQALIILYGNQTGVWFSEYGNTCDFEVAEIAFQPLVGAAGSSWFTQKHWQDITVAFRAPQPSTVSTVTVRAQSANGLSAGTRDIPSASYYFADGETVRVGFTVPRQWPAMANTIAPYVVFTSPSVTGPQAGLTGIQLEGLQINYVDFTEQRIKR